MDTGWTHNAMLHRGGRAATGRQVLVLLDAYNGNLIPNTVCSSSP